jgi:hypothetical protein
MRLEGEQAADQSAMVTVAVFNSCTVSVNQMVAKGFNFSLFEFGPGLEFLPAGLLVFLQPLELISEEKGVEVVVVTAEGGPFAGIKAQLSAVKRDHGLRHHVVELVQFF